MNARRKRVGRAKVGSPALHSDALRVFSRNATPFSRTPRECKRKTHKTGSKWGPV